MGGSPGKGVNADPAPTGVCAATIVNGGIWNRAEILRSGPWAFWPSPLPSIGSFGEQGA
jgi:hypothetical protein